MKVQRTRFEDSSRSSWIVLDDGYLPISPILAFIKFLEDLGRSPFTVRSAAYNLKLFWEFLRDEALDWKNVDVAHLAAFITWLRDPQPGPISLDVHEARRTDASIDQILTTVHVFYDFHTRMKHLPDIHLYQFLTMPNRRYKPFLHGIAKLKPVQTRIVKVKREERRIKTLTRGQVQQLLDACTHLRDKFLLALLYETGMRIGQALGLRHSDISIEDGELRIVPRDNNVNGARAKARAAYTIPVKTSLLELYTDYLVEDLGALDADHLPDYVFVNLWEGEIGSPVTYEAIMSLLRRLCRKTGVRATPHMFRHTRATEWIRDDGLSLEVVSRLLGHRDIQTTHDTYVNLTAQDLRKAQEDAEKRKGKQITHEQ